MLGEALRLLRVLNNIKINELSKELGISSSHISEIENNKKTPSLDLIQRYAGYFGVSASSILFFSEELEEKKNSKAGLKKSVRNKALNVMKFLEKINQDA